MKYMDELSNPEYTIEQLQQKGFSLTEALQVVKKYIEANENKVKIAYVKKVYDGDVDGDPVIEQSEVEVVNNLYTKQMDFFIKKREEFNRVVDRKLKELIYEYSSQNKNEFMKFALEKMILKIKSQLQFHFDPMRAINWFDNEFKRDIFSEHGYKSGINPTTLLQLLDKQCEKYKQSEVEEQSEKTKLKK